MDFNYFGTYDEQHGGVGEETPAAGECKIYNQNKPMDLAAFSDMPVDLQTQYLKNLRTKHGGRVKDIAHMFGCKPKLVQDLLKENRIPYIDKGIKSSGDAAAWCAFTEGYQFPEEPECKEEDAPARTEEGISLEATSSGPAGHLPLEGKALDGRQRTRRADADATGGTGEPAPTESGGGVTSVLRAFRVELKGPMDEVFRYLEAFADVVGRLPVSVTVEVDT